MSLHSTFALLTKSICIVFSLLAPLASQAGIGTAGSPLVLYSFMADSGSKVYDISGNGTPLDLDIRDTDKTRWLQGGGLAIDGPTLIAATGPARKITDAVKASNALTIEAWIEPASKTQTGPARIISLSADTLNRNLTLGQNNTTYDIRLRTMQTNDNGTPSQQTSKDSVDIKLTHVVYTRSSNGLARLYIDGVLKSKKRTRGNLDNWDTGYRFALANELDGNRPWTGIFYQVAIYSRTLSKTEVSRNFTSGTIDFFDTATNPIDSSGSNNRGIPILNSGKATTLPGSSTITSGATTVPKTGSVFLGWNAPFTRSNGDALAMGEIAGYTIYYGNTAGIYPNSISISDAYVTSTTISGLPSDTYYFVITARDTAGRESVYSNMATKPVI